VLGAGALVVVERLQLERPVVRGLLGRAEWDRVQVRMEDGSSHAFHLARYCRRHSAETAESAPN